MNKTEDLQVMILDALADGPLTLDEMEQRIPPVDDRRWIGVALGHLKRDGEIRYLMCDAEHNHAGGCVIAIAPLLDGDGNVVDPDGAPVDPAIRLFFAGRVPEPDCDHYMYKSERDAGFTRAESCRGPR
jgi:hypothetical protein